MAYIGVSPSNGVRQKHTYTATASQTTFSGAGAEGVSLSYRDSNYVDVYVNGVKLGDADYTATSGTSIVFDPGLSVNDIVEVIVYDVFSIADTVSKADGGVFDGNVTMAGTLAVTGETTLSANLNLGDNDKAIFGAGSDLQIYHDGSNSYVRDAGDGRLNLRSDGAGIDLQTSTGATMVRANKDADVRIYYNNSQKLATTNTGIDVTGVITTDGMTTSADINFGDSDKAVFGADSDLQIYHDGSHSIIADEGTGQLKISTNGTNIQLNKGSSENMLVCTVDGSVELYYDGDPRLTTTSTGIDVTGTATMDAFQVESSIVNLYLMESDTTDLNTLLRSNSGNFTVQTITDDKGTGTPRFKIENSTGDISFYEDTGNTPKLFWDASAERLGLGTTSPASLLEIKATSLNRANGIALRGSGANDVLYMYPSADNVATIEHLIDGTTNTGGVLSINPQGGNVGIGTSSPSQKVQVSGAGSQYVSVVSTNSGNTGVLFGDSGQVDQGYVLYANSDDSLRIGTSNTERMRIRSTGKIGLGTSNADAELHIEPVSGGANASILLSNDGRTQYFRIQNNETDDALTFNANDTSERMRIDSSGNVGIGTTSPQDIIDIRGGANSSFIFGSGANGADSTLTLEFRDRYGTSGFGQGQIASFIKNVRDGSSGDYDLTFGTNTGTTTNASERMRINSSGVLLVGITDANDIATTQGASITGAGSGITRSSGFPVLVLRKINNYAGEMIRFVYNGSTDVGSIDITSSSTSYNTSSDHRLKENVTADWDATTRLKQLNPVRFNFIADADTTVDGFLAHEVQSVVPEAITGTHNEVKVWREHEELPDGVSVGDNKLDDDGNTIPVYQGIDQSKLVPLLVKTIQELEARIVALENAE